MEQAQKDLDKEEDPVQEDKATNIEEKVGISESIQRLKYPQDSEMNEINTEGWESDKQAKSQDS